jgi:pimeloyl-ACP methyl ester carboxylesterase
LEIKTYTPLYRNLVFVNTLICGIIGAAMGSVGNFLLWLIGGLLAGALIGWGGEIVLGKLIKSPKLHLRRMLILVLSEVLLIIYVGLPFYRAYQITHPARFPVVNTPADLGLNYEEITLTADEGIRLAGWYIPSRNGAGIIAIHGSNGNRTHMLHHAAILAQHGYGVLLFDLRAHGESGGDIFPAANDSSDVLAAVAFLQNRPEIDPQRIGGIGLSLGAMVIIQGAARTQAIQAVIADGADANRLDDYFPLPPQYQVLAFMIPHLWMTDRIIELMSGVPAIAMKELVREIAPRPLLLISTGQDHEQFINRRFYEVGRPTTQLWELPDTGHTGGIFAHPEEYIQRMLAFFDTNLLETVEVEDKSEH